MSANGRLRLRCPIVVEGKYDKIRLANLVETPIIALNGFAVFKDKEKLSLLRRASCDRGLLLLTDSDRAGQFLRGRLKGLLPPDAKIRNVYIPAVAGKEPRKRKRSADGLLGVEGIDDGILRALLAPFEAEDAVVGDVSREEWYADGFSGGKNSAEKRKMLAEALGLPATLTSGGLLEAVNWLCGREAYEDAKRRIG